jgi:hypothetical protein
MAPIPRSLGLKHYDVPRQIPQTQWDIAEANGYDHFIRQKQWLAVAAFSGSNKKCDACLGVWISLVIHL